MKLSQIQQQQFFEHGLVQISGVIPQPAIDRAVRAINHSLGTAGLPPAEMPSFRARTFCPEITHAAAITNLVTEPAVVSLCEFMFGADKLHPVNNGQVALRFPVLEDRPGSAGPHIDGMYSPNNGVEQGTIQNFTALLCVLLSDLPEPNAGNFTVWPGSHLSNAQYFREHGPQSLLQGLPQVALPAPVQITGRAGDIVLAHYLLMHGVTPNIAPHIRYACFFRLSHVDLATQKWESMTDPWLHWPGMQSQRATVQMS